MVYIAEVVKEEVATQGTVVVFGGDPVVGKALELLLRMAGYDARYLYEDASNRSRGLDRAQVVLLGPRWMARSRKAFEEAIEDVPDAADITLLELGAPADGAQIESSRYVPWPCRMDELRLRIDSSLRGEHEAGSGV